MDPEPGHRSDQPLPALRIGCGLSGLRRNRDDVHVAGDQSVSAWEPYRCGHRVGLFVRRPPERLFPAADFAALCAVVFLQR